MSLLGLNKKEDVFSSMHLPELPALPENRTLPALPSLPPAQSINQFNNEMVKSAVVDSGENEVTSPDSNSRDYFSLMQPAQHIQMQQKPKQNELVFVRIDKFQDAQKDFNDVKVKVKEIESLLREVKAINQKEDAQVSEWVKDLEKVKTLLIEIDSKVFNQL